MNSKIPVAFMFIFLALSIISSLSIIGVVGSTTHHVFPGQSIQNTINAAQSGDTIFVHAGTYYENVVVNKTISLIGENRITTIIDGNLTGLHIIDVRASNVLISNFAIRNSGNYTPFCSGIILRSGKNNCNMTNNLITNNQEGIFLESVSGINIKENEITDNGMGIEVVGSSTHNNISMNILANNNLGIMLNPSSNDNVISRNNIISNRQYGLYLWESDNNMLIGNLIIQNHVGFYQVCSTGNTLVANEMTDNTYTFGVFSHPNEPSLSHYMHNIDTSNQVNGRPIYYLVNKSTQKVPNNAGFVGVINSEDITVSNLSLSNNIQGVLLAYTTRSSIIDACVSNSLVGIMLDHSDEIIIDCNFIEKNTPSPYTSGIGIGLVHSNMNVISQNNISNNDFGIWLLASQNNDIYHNNFCARDQAIVQNSSNNAWDDGYPSGGNYWSDYTGTDSDGDGIGDTPYEIDENNRDNYPLMYPWNQSLRKSAVIIDPFYSEWGLFKNLVYDVQGSLEVAGYSVSSVQDTGVTVEWLRDGLKHGVVLWRGHTVQGTPSGIGLITGEVVTYENALEYKDDIENFRIVNITKGSSKYWVTTPAFIEYYYTSNRFQYSLVVVEGCSSLSDSSLASTFIDAGVATYVGYTTEVQEPLTSFDMKTLFKNLCEKGYTVGEAVDSVFWGKGLLEYFGDAELRLTYLKDATASIAFVIQSPANLYVTDPEGYHIGFDPITNQSVIEILEAMYTGPEIEPQVIWIPYALNCTYSILLVGTESGSYNLTVGISSLSQTNTETWVGVITTNQTVQLEAFVLGTELEVIPEFPSFLILPLFMAATLLAVIIIRRKHRANLRIPV